MRKLVGLNNDFIPSLCKRINKGNGTIRQTVTWIETEYKKITNLPDYVVYSNINSFKVRLRIFIHQLKRQRNLDHHF